MKPLRLTWWLASPVATTGHPLHLDALVAYAMTEKRLRDATFDSSPGVREQTIRSLADELPLEREVREGEWVWKASAMVPDKSAITAHGMRMWTRKTDVNDFAHRVGANQIGGGERGREFDESGALKLKRFALKIDTSRGILKNQFKFFPVKTIEKLQAWCVGDEEELTSLLHPDAGFIQNIGARGRSGLGVVTRFEIAQDPLASTLWERRVTPWPYHGAAPLQLATRPPYWEIKNRRAAYCDPAIFI